MSRAVKVLCAAITLLLVLFILSINQSLASLAGSFYPAAVFWVNVGLLGVEIACFCYFWLAIFGRKHNLRFSKNRTPEEHEAFAKELNRRLQYNSHLKNIPFDPYDEKYTEKCLNHLADKANAEIKRTAERVFLATALSQNGRIDALIVFVSLCRLVWCISGIYNQKPHPSEIVSLYSAVATSAFLALSFEELDISTEITVGFGETFQAVAPAAMSGGVPFVGTALQKFTASAIDGAANCYLVLRAGIITRNAYTYGALEEEQPNRSAVYKEAGGILLGMANRLVDQVAKTLGDKLWGMTKAAPQKTAQAVVDSMSRVGSGISAGTEHIISGVGAGAGKVVAGAGKVAYSTADAVHMAGTSIKEAGKSVSTAVGETAVKTGQAMSKTGSSVIKTGLGTVATGVKFGRSLTSDVKNTVKKTGSSVFAPFRKKKE